MTIVQSGRSIRTALSIAGSDAGGGAGVQADLKTFAALGVYGTTAITAVTAQNTTELTSVHTLSADLVTAQIETVASDIEIHATKTGMLVSSAIVEAVAATIKELDLPMVVVDPVMLAKDGTRLLDEDGIEALKSELLPLALVTTPNIPEAEVLSGVRIASVNDAREAARRIQALGPRNVIVTGGHGTGHDLVDLLFDGERFHEFRTPRVITRNTHGTGCTFASAIAAWLAKGLTLVEATARAQTFVAGALRNTLAVGNGNGPLNHFWWTESPFILDR